MNSVFISLFSTYQTCQTEVKLFQCFAFSLATCTKNQEQSRAWTDNKSIHHLIWLSETINILFSLCTFKPDIHSHASELSLDAFAPATLDPFLPPRLTVSQRPWNNKVSLIQTVNISWPYNYMKSNLDNNCSFILHYQRGRRRGKQRGWKGMK